MPSPTDPHAGGVPDGPAPLPLDGREVVVAVCGGIAAYKSAYLVSRLVQVGAGVTVCMTENATRFIGALTFRALTGRAVHTDPWADEEAGDIRHLSLAERCDLVVLAPATANMLAKAANGIADDLVSALLLGAGCPVLAAPAMNPRMWKHAATQRNLAFLRETGVRFVGPSEGWLACRDEGPGRMSEPDEIFTDVVELLRPER